MKSLEDYAIETRKFSDNLLIAYELYCLRCLLENMGFSGVNIKTSGDNILRVMG